MARTRSAKALAQRVDREYFKRPTRLDVLRRRLSWAATLLALAFVGWALLPSNRLVWSRGPVSAAHRFVEEDCGACHGSPRQTADVTAAVVRIEQLLPLHTGASEFGPATDANCIACHRAAAHQAKQPAPPACAACHAQHGAESPSARCTSCHARLAEFAPSTRFAAVSGFAHGHPEFAALKAPDPSRLKLNHDVHLWPGLKGPDGPSPLGCSSCHEPDAHGRSFVPVRYERHCKDCHALTLPGDHWLDEESVPHGDVARVVQLVEARLPTNIDASAPTPSAGAVMTQLADQVCARCHFVGQSAEALAAPRIEPVKVPERWMPLARFDHRAHRALGCVACHRGVSTSRRSEDVLLPSKADCARCHDEQGGAPTQCAHCHRYHPILETPLGPGLFDLPH